MTVEITKEGARLFDEENTDEVKGVVVARETSLLSKEVDGIGPSRVYEEKFSTQTGVGEDKAGKPLKVVDGEIHVVISSVEQNCERNG